jgi:hypothetical protein
VPGIIWPHHVSDLGYSLKPWPDLGNSDVYGN